MEGRLSPPHVPRHRPELRAEEFGAGGPRPFTTPSTHPSSLPPLTCMATADLRDPSSSQTAVTGANSALAAEPPLVGAQARIRGAWPVVEGEGREGLGVV